MLTVVGTLLAVSMHAYIVLMFAVGVAEGKGTLFVASRHLNSPFLLFCTGAVNEWNVFNAFACVLLFWPHKCDPNIDIQATWSVLGESFAVVPSGLGSSTWEPRTANFVWEKGQMQCCSLYS